ncbi:hypothetical protein B0O99DRAFT_522425, partial [Bisporella sp. PMI_857]
IQNCLCRNTTLQGQLSACILVSCSRTEQYVSTSVSQNVICKGIPQPSRSGAIVRVVVASTVIAIPIIVLRLFSRYTTSYIWWDDWVIAGAGASYNMDISSVGMGKHLWDVPPENLVTLQLLYYVSQMLYVGTKALAKISILLLFLRIFPDERFRLATKIFLVWILCAAFTFFIAIALQCIPVHAVWDMSVRGKCINLSALVFSGAGLSIFEDTVIILLPVFELKSLRLTLAKRLLIIFVFAMGSFACITSIVRLQYLVTSHIRSLDVTWDSTNIIIWSILEGYSAVFCGCLITIRPLLVKHFPSIFQSTRESQRHSTYNLPSYRMGPILPSTPRNPSHGSEVELNSVCE